MVDSDAPKDRERRGRRNTTATLVAAALLPGIVFYNLGRFASCTAKWLENNQAAQSSSVMPRAFEYDGGDPDSPAYYSHSSRPRSIAGSIDRRFVPRMFPYDCGVVFFYHIPSTGGSSINGWFRKYSKPTYGNISYYQKWGLAVKKDGTFAPNPEKTEAEFARGMSEHIQNLGPFEWRVAHSHIMSTYLNESEDLLYKWRRDVEAQGCQLINTVMLRDPLNHAMSLHKIIKAKNSSREEWTEYLSSGTGPGKWATVLDFFLYNIHGLRYREEYPNGSGGRNPFNVTKEVKVARAMELLHRHFDVVTVADHATFMDLLLNLTGWMPIDMRHRNVFKKTLNFTKKEVENLQKLLQQNGDIDFIDQVKMEYHGYLSYLSDTGL